MSYPFFQAPTLDDLAERLRAHGVTLETTKTLVSINGRPAHTIHYFKREADGIVLKAVAEALPDERLTNSILRSVLALLRLDPRSFGFDLD